MIGEYWLLFLMVIVQPHILRPDYTGYAAHYSPGLMERVSHNRDMDVVDCMISSPYYKLDVWVVVTSLKNNKTKICRITDVSHPRDRQRHIRRKLIAELDFNSAKYICDISRVGQEPYRKCPVTLKRYYGNPNKTEQPKAYTGAKLSLVVFNKPQKVGSLYFQD